MTPLVPCDSASDPQLSAGQHKARRAFLQEALVNDTVGPAAAFGELDTKAAQNFAGMLQQQTPNGLDLAGLAPQQANGSLSVPADPSQPAPAPLMQPAAESTALALPSAAARPRLIGTVPTRAPAGMGPAAGPGSSGGSGGFKLGELPYPGQMSSASAAAQARAQIGASTSGRHLIGQVPSLSRTAPPQASAPPLLLGQMPAGPTLFGQLELSVSAPGALLGTGPPLVQPQHTAPPVMWGRQPASLSTGSFPPAGGAGGFIGATPGSIGTTMLQPGAYGALGGTNPSGTHPYAAHFFGGVTGQFPAAAGVMGHMPQPQPQPQFQHRTAPAATAGPSIGVLGTPAVSAPGPPASAESSRRGSAAGTHIGRMSLPASNDSSFMRGSASSTMSGYGGSALVDNALALNAALAVERLQSRGSVMSNHTSGNSMRERKVKALCSSGGHFRKLPSGGLEYVDGETRLVTLSNYCSHAELNEALERVTQSQAMYASGSTDHEHSLKYQMPGDPSIYVDLIDDEDVKLMFGEWEDYQAMLTSSAAGASAASKGSGARERLHIFVQWHRDPVSLPSNPDDKAQPSHESAARHGSVEEPMESPEAASPQALAPRGYEDLADRMEVIDPADIKLVKFLGSGGYGEVYLGKWHSSEAAIKCLNPSLFLPGGDGSSQVSDIAYRELIREAELLGSLRHPNVVWVYGVVLPPKRNTELLNKAGSADSEDTGSADSRSVPGHDRVRPPAIVTEFMSQGSLKGALSRKAEIIQGPLSRVMVALDAAKGMEYLHSKRIVHFDLKSANLLLGHRDRRAICKVADFGLSKQKRETYVSGVSSQRGTLPWIAPEIIKTPEAVTEKVDVFSFGVVMWELWTGKEPYEGLNYHALLHQITTSIKGMRPPMPGSPEWEGEPLPEMAPGWKALMQKCWAERPTGRPTFTEIVAELRTMATAVRPARKPRPPPAASGPTTAALPSPFGGASQQAHAQPQASAGPPAPGPFGGAQTQAVAAAAAGNGQQAAAAAAAAAVHRQASAALPPQSPAVQRLASDAAVVADRQGSGVLPLRQASSPAQVAAVQQGDDGA